ncbi:MAG: hypothetical protein RBS56_00605 [Candidatus Gracilibacteria bacterium]|nr:hypothetical protein [Candidatus Gracilibacteria bacterium]
MKKTLPKAILIYITILCLIILAVVIKNMLTSVPIGPETDSLFTCTGMRSAEQWNCDFWQFFKQNIIVDTVLTGLFMPQYTLIFIILSILSVFGIEKLLRGISNKK